MSNRAFVIISVGLMAVIGVLLVVNRPVRSNVRSQSAPASTAQGSSSFRSGGPELIVRADGETVAEPAYSGDGSRLSDLALEQITPSLISHVRTVGTSTILVLTDGSEVPVGASARDRLPASVQYRLEYERSGR